MISVVIPTLWKPNGFLDRLQEISKIDLVGEIILIDNDILKNIDLSYISKINHIKESQNLYVIPSWNKGVSLAKYDKLLIVNDDVETNWKIIEEIEPFITEDKGMIGASINCWHCEEEKNQMSPTDYMPNCYACLFFIHKESYTPIPEVMKVHYGDNWLFNNLSSIGKQNYTIDGWKLGGDAEQTSGLKEFDVIKQQDRIAYNNILI
jgi:hypothetical protein